MKKVCRFVYKFQFVIFFGYLSSQQQPTNEVVVERHSNGIKKIVNVYRGSGINEVMIAKYGFYDSGIKYFIENYKNNLKNGLFTKWNYNGIKVLESNMLNNKRSGSLKEWYDNGELSFSGNYMDDMKTGLQEWYYKNGNKSESSEYSLGEKDGNSKQWYEDGRIKFNHNYKNDKYDGLQEEYYENGNKSESSEYSLGEKDGNSKQWYEDGQIKFNYNYKNDKYDGLQEDYLKDGTKTLESNMLNNKRNGSLKQWYDNGELSFSGNYKDGEMHGLQEWYNDANEDVEPNGIKYKSVEYSFGKLNGQAKEWFYNGKLKFMCNYKDDKRDGIYEQYYENGEKMLIQEFSLGVLNGKYSRFDDQGVLTSKGIFTNGLMEGKWLFKRKVKDVDEIFTCIINYKKGNGGDKGYLGVPWNGGFGEVKYLYESGVKFIEFELQNGKANGDYFEYFENGNIKVFQQYKDNKLNGKAIEKDSNGKLIKAYEEYNGIKEPIVTVYNGDNLNGKKKSFYELPIKVDFTKYSYYDNDDITLFNDNITSIDILPGYQIKVFEDDSFKGRYAIFSSDDILSHLKNFKLNDEISSLTVTLYNPESFVVKFYSDGNYKGKYFSYGPGQIKNMKKETNFNDDISSIMIKEGYKVKIYQNDSFNGISTELIESVSELKSLNMNDDMSSFIIERL